MSPTCKHLIGQVYAISSFCFLFFFLFFLARSLPPSEVLSCLLFFPSPRRSTYSEVFLGSSVILASTPASSRSLGNPFSSFQSSDLQRTLSSPEVPNSSDIPSVHTVSSVFKRIQFLLFVCCFEGFRSLREMRRPEAMAFFILLLFFAPLTARSAVLSIDLGSESLKVAVVNLKPGQSPISIAINEMSKRKSPALVAFSNGHRLVGEEASGIAARYPERVYSRVRDMVGKPFGEVKKFLDSLYLPYDIVEDARGTANIRIEDGETIYSLEELLAMILNYAKGLAESHVKGIVKDAVISVPPFLGQAERECILDAAQLAGLTVLALINEHSGAALQYGIDKDFSNSSRNVIFYDVGAGSAYAALVHYSAYTTKEFGKTVTANQFQVKDVRWDTSLGGQAMEMKLVEYFADEFNKQVGGGFNIRQHTKALAKLKKEVKRTKEVLSANTEAPLSVEALYDDRDFRSTITRAKFEELCEELLEQALGPIKEVLIHSGLTVDELHAVEVIGGASRVPKLQAILQEFLGKKDLDRHLDADEAVALGAALHAANISDGFKMNRKLGMVDGISYGIFMKVENIGSKEDKEPNYQQVVPRFKKLPSKLFKSLKNSDDFKVSLVYDTDGVLPPGITSNEIATFQIIGVAEAHTKYASRNLSAPIKTNLHFSLGRSGVLSLDKAETVIEVSEWVDVPVKTKLLENRTETESNKTVIIDGSQQSENDVVKEGGEENDAGGVGNRNQKSNDGVDSNGDQKSTEVDSEHPKPSKENDTQSSENESAADVKPAFEKKLKKRTFRVPLKIKEVSAGIIRSMPKDVLKEASLRLEKLNRQDAQKKKTAEAKNNLEAYIYATKDKLDSLDELGKISTEEQREFLRQQLNDAEDWLYTDGENASASEFEERLESLKAIGESIFFRLAELTARPAALEVAQKYIDGLTETLVNWEKSKPWISQSSKDELLREAKDVLKWLQEKVKEQEGTPGHEPPVLTSEEIYMKVVALQEKVTKLGKTPKPKPQAEKKTAGNQNESTSSENDVAQENSSEENENVKIESGIDGQSSMDAKEKGAEFHDEL